jgi:hypothetical protein
MTTEPTMSKTNIPTLSSAAFLAAATAFLYCASTAYMGGYLGTLRLDSDVLDRNFHQVLYSGFLTSFETLLWALIVCASASYVWAYMLFPLFTNYLKKGVAQRRKAVRIKRFFYWNNRPDTKRERIWKNRTRWALALALLPLALILLLAYYEQRGRSAANELLLRVSRGQPAASEIVRVKIDDQVRTLVHLACGARNCAGLEMQSEMVYYYPQTGHAYHYSVVKSKAPK